MNYAAICGWTLAVENIMIVWKDFSVQPLPKLLIFLKCVGPPLGTGPSAQRQESNLHHPDHNL
jgi:hypothetical protein